MSQIRDLLEQQFPGPPLTIHYDELVSEYQHSGLARPDVVQELTSGGERALWALIWEAMLYRHLTNLGFKFRRDRVKKSGGPDFGIPHDGRTIWIEAVVPAPEGIPGDYLRPPKRGEVEFRSRPYDEILLRWTTVLKEKRDKLRRYAERGIIADNDCAVVAVNASRLSDFPGNDQGSSRFPLAVEAVLPVGPIAAPITPQGESDGETERTIRRSIRKPPTGVEIPTTNFLDPAYANVSAIIGSSRGDMLDGNLLLTLVHNPLAKVSLPRGILSTHQEFVADKKGEGYLLRSLE